MMARELNDYLAGLFMAVAAGVADFVDDWIAPYTGQQYARDG